jgi:hypothetical protein
MAVTKLSNSGIKTGILKYDSMLAGNAAYDPAATWLIQRVAGTGSSTTITFSSIPQTYTSLQLRFSALSATAGDDLLLRINGDTATNYTRHLLYGDNTTVTAAGVINQTSGLLDSGAAPTSTTQPFVGIIDFHNYTSTTQNKTVRIFSGIDKNGSGEVNLNSNLWRSTSAITSISIIANSYNFTTSSTFALYGFKGA